ncbi:hypothetical protein NESM_000262400 [Novymonas esmeraldas]|uniref:Uncharacterized protein n=1 Tax=Novymonas esmeraldas TaxID=1808958 RepID=A0AAW0F6S9_9TRYP
MECTSTAVARQQLEWSDKLRRTVVELHKVTTIAFRSHAAYTEAMARMGELYKYCSTLMERAAAQHLAETHSLTDAQRLTEVSSRLHRSLEKWSGASDEIALHSFLQAQTDHWQEWDRDLARMALQHKKRQDVCEQVDKLRSKLKKESSSSKSSSTAALEKEVAALTTLQRTCDKAVRNDIEYTSRELCKEVTRMGTKLTDIMSACGQVCAHSFQPAATDPTDRRTSSGTSAGGPSSHSSAAVAGVVLHRPPSPTAESGARRPEDTEVYGTPSAYTRRPVATPAAASTPHCAPPRPSTNT